MRQDVGDFTIANISYISNVEFGWVKYWRMAFGSSVAKVFPCQNFELYGMYMVELWPDVIC